MVSLRALAAGATTPSLPALAGALGVALALALGVVFGLRLEHLGRVEEGWILLGKIDDYGRLTSEVARHASRPWGPASALLFGPSSTREELSSQEAFAAAISTAARQGVAVLNFAADDESLAEYAGVLDALPGGFSGVVALTVSPTMLARFNERRIERQTERGGLEVGWVSPARDRALRSLGVEVPRRTGIYAIDVAPFLLARSRLPLQWVLRGPMTFEWHRNKGEVPLANLAENRRTVRARLSRYDDSAAGSLAVLDELMTSFAAKSEAVRFLLVEQTELPGVFVQVVGADRYAGYQADVAALAARRGDAEYLDVNPWLERQDFFDLIHLGRPQGHHKVTERLGRRIGIAIRELPHDLDR
jgi:hypothetical protein